ncbi:hypothetical protein ACQKWADRAFT_143337 [Trichoderma austrokoningii]
MVPNRSNMQTMRCYILSRLLVLSMVMLLLLSGQALPCCHVQGRTCFACWEEGDRHVLLNTVLQSVSRSWEHGCNKIRSTSQVLKLHKGSGFLLAILAICIAGEEKNYNRIH